MICVSFLDLETNLYVECGEDGSSCVEMSSDSLTNTTCYMQSHLNYRWDPTLEVCVNCTPPVSGVIVSILMIIYVISL